MKILKFLFPVAIATAIFLHADQTVTTSVANGQNVVIPDQGKITTSGTVTIQSGGKAVYVGGTGVTLLPGFTAVSGSQFRATADLNLGNFMDLTDSDLDGLPDAWEILHFGNLTTSNGSGDYDGDGVSDAAEYRAGTNPILNEGTQTMPGTVNVVLKMPNGKFKGVNTSSWAIIAVP